MEVFGKYSKYYDLIYREKNYPEEVNFIRKIIGRFSKKKIHSILSLGCGSGNHEVLLGKKGYKIFGVDRSETMLALFRKKIEKLELGKHISLKKANVTSFSTSRRFDCAISMFNVVGYQTDNANFEKMLKNVNRSLKKGSLFIFDCWHAPAVLKDKPTDRIKEINLGNRKIIRLTNSVLDLINNVINIRFKVFDIANSKVASVVEEVHPMRYWTTPELRYFLTKSGFEFMEVLNFLDFKSRVSDDKWDIFVIARKI